MYYVFLEIQTGNQKKISVVSPFLNKGMNFAIFIFIGTLPLSYDTFIIYTSGSTTEVTTPFIMKLLI